MPKILDYLNLSFTARSIDNFFSSPEEFQKNYRKILETETHSYIRHYLINNPAFVFKEIPMLYEQIIKYIADELLVNENDVKLIGSGKTGFSISRPPKYGKAFQNSDLDFTIINQYLFKQLKDEFYSLIDLDNGNENYLGLNYKNYEYWQKNVHYIPKILNREFIDPKFLPYISLTPISSHIAEIMTRIKNNLQKIYSIEIKQPSVRVYKDWHSFLKVLKFNTESVLESIH